MSLTSDIVFRLECSGFLYNFVHCRMIGVSCVSGNIGIERKVKDKNKKAASQRLHWKLGYICSRSRVF